MSNGTTTWTYTYDGNGLRTKRTDGTNTYTYTYIDGQLWQFTVNGQVFSITYDVTGSPWTLQTGDALYFYVTNLQGDVVALVDWFGNVAAVYTYDAWGNPLSVTGTLASTIGVWNPLRYRGYVYDQETGLYYLQSRYYNPEVGRFLNADNQIAGVGGEVLGYNMFVYCFNNPVNMSDPSGNWPKLSKVFKAVAAVAAVVAVAAAVVVSCGAAAPVVAAITGLGVSSASATAVVTSVAITACNVAVAAATTAIVTSTVETTSYQGPVRDQSVYVMKDKTTNEVQYVGRTNDPVRRRNEHAKDPTKANLKPLEVKFSGLTKVEARVMEQVLISAYSLDNLANARREIAVGNVDGFAGKIENVVRIFVGVGENELLNLMEW